MALIQWNDKLSVQNAAMDAQHKKLIDLINELNDAMQQRRAKEVIDQTFSGVIAYVSTHFSSEETLLKTQGYPGLAQQQSEHAAFVAQIKTYKDKYDQGNTLVSVELLKFLMDWLIKHIQVSDKQYGVFLTGKGIK